MLKKIAVATSSRSELIDITDEVNKAVSESKVSKGLCVVYVPHTTAGLTVNENADPSVKGDIVRTLEGLVPASGPYRHEEGNSDAHVKSSIVGHETTLIIEDGRLVLGTWQGVFLCEFDGPRQRSVYVRVLKG